MNVLFFGISEEMLTVETNMLKNTFPYASKGQQNENLITCVFFVIKVQLVSVLANVYVTSS